MYFDMEIRDGVLVRRVDMLKDPVDKRGNVFGDLQPRNVMECVFSVSSKCSYFSGLVLGEGSHFRY